MARRAEVPVEIHRFAASLAGLLKKIREGAETPNCDIRLTHQECKDLVKTLQLLKGNDNGHD